MLSSVDAPMNSLRNLLRSFNKTSSFSFSERGSGPPNWSNSDRVVRKSIRILSTIAGRERVTCLCSIFNHIKRKFVTPTVLSSSAKSRVPIRSPAFLNCGWFAKKASSIASASWRFESDMVCIRTLMVIPFFNSAWLIFHAICHTCACPALHSYITQFQRKLLESFHQVLKVGWFYQVQFGQHWDCPFTLNKSTLIQLLVAFFIILSAESQCLICLQIGIGRWYGQYYCVRIAGWCKA